MENEYTGEFGCDPDSDRIPGQFSHWHDIRENMATLFNDLSSEIKIGDKVVILSFVSTALKDLYNDTTFEVTGINIIDEYDTELMLDVYPWLVYLRDVKVTERSG